MIRPVLTTLAVTLGVAASGCSASNDSSGPCAERSGSYSGKWTTRDGDCGNIPETVNTYADQKSAQDQVPTSCTGTIKTSTDNCTVNIDVTCPGDNKVSIKQSGVAHWSEDGASGTATVGMTITDSKGSTLCTGSYDVSYSKL